jgi:hypothetical protein
MPHRTQLLLLLLLPPRQRPQLRSLDVALQHEQTVVVVVVAMDARPHAWTVQRLINTSCDGCGGGGGGGGGGGVILLLLRRSCMTAVLGQHSCYAPPVARIHYPDVLRAVPTITQTSATTSQLAAWTTPIRVRWLRQQGSAYLSAVGQCVLDDPHPSTIDTIDTIDTIANAPL